uniref:Uncharacterized protein n=1 Tax=viral metagenome TaxID=1070528 RepID=A0A6C0DUL8_9ZZZZ
MNTNNRFNVLLENNNNNNNNKTKIVKNNEPKSATFNNFRSNNYTNNRHQDEIDYRKFKEEKLKKQKEEDIVKALDISNFPELKNISIASINKNQNKETDKTSFADMMKNSTQNLDGENKVTVEEDEIVNPGCVCIKHDVKTNQPKWIYGEGCSKMELDKQNENDVSEVLDEDPFYVFERLTKLYQNRKNDHINKWGYDEYDKMFLFQNYDYDYFDKLDEKFEREFNNHFYKANNNDYDNYELY